jgi:'Cold-shock' DNA-binding domain
MEWPARPGDPANTWPAVVFKAGGFRGLQDNQRVEFTAGRGAKGPRAEEVRAI